MEVKVTNSILNLVELQEKLDRVVFEQIDTSQNWVIANERLAQLLQQITTYYQDVLNQRGGQLPKANSYWVLFLNSAAKVVYFYHYTKYQLSNDLNEQQKQEILQGYLTASRILPNNLSDENEELLLEVTKSIEEINSSILIEHHVNKVQDCLAVFKTYVEGSYLPQ